MKSHPADEGAVHRALWAAASELGYADQLYLLDPEGVHTERVAAQARTYAFFTIGHVAEHDVCDVDRALERVRCGDLTPDPSEPHPIAARIRGYYQSLLDLVT